MIGFPEHNIRAQFLYMLFTNKDNTSANTKACIENIKIAMHKTRIMCVCEVSDADTKMMKEYVNPFEPKVLQRIKYYRYNNIYSL
jgi:hypothetical protein